MDRAHMEKEKMGALLGVARGTAEPPKFIVLHYRGDPSKKEVIGLVGKGLTFDSGGISLKPQEFMSDMKGDMSGGAVVIAAMDAIAQMKPAVNVTALIPATENLPGGRALKFYASVRLDIRRIETIKTGTESIGSRVRVKVVKNKVAPPFRVAEFDVMYGEGISREGGLLDVGVAMDVVTKTGSWFTFGDTRLGQGREASKDFLRSNRDVGAEIERLIRARVAEARIPVEGIEEAE